MIHFEHVDGPDIVLTLSELEDLPDCPDPFGSSRSIRRWKREDPDRPNGWLVGEFFAVERRWFSPLKIRWRPVFVVEVLLVQSLLARAGLADAP